MRQADSSRDGELSRYSDMYVSLCYEYEDVLFTIDLENLSTSRMANFPFIRVRKTLPLAGSIGIFSTLAVETFFTKI